MVGMQLDFESIVEYFRMAILEELLVGRVSKMVLYSGGTILEHELLT